MCGDSTMLSDVQKLMNGQKARFVFTDPPWNVDYGSDTRHPSWKPRQILNDNMSTEEFGAFLLRAFKCMKEVSEAWMHDLCCYVCSGVGKLDAFFEREWIPLVINNNLE